eukprot:SAG11_NODE_86_length_17300_cov_11.466717_8_plen_115_part_00
MYPKMASHQRALYVPPAFSSGYNRPNEVDSVCCPANTHNRADPGPNPDCEGNCTRAMVQWAAGAYYSHYYSTATVGAGVPVRLKKPCVSLLLWMHADTRLIVVAVGWACSSNLN